jgi:hypothetical protein
MILWARFVRPFTLRFFTPSGISIYGDCRTHAITRACSFCLLTRVERVLPRWDFECNGDCATL